MALLRLAAPGRPVECIRRFDGRQGYVVVEPESVQLALAFS